jgi:hypothetical protein
MTTLFENPVIAEDNQDPGNLRSLPATSGSFVLLGTVVGGLGFGAVAAVISQIEAEQRRSRAPYWSFEQYDRLFAACDTPQPKWEMLLLAVVGLKVRCRQARAAGLSAWQFAQAEERRRQDDAQAEARRAAVNTQAVEKSKADSYAKRVAELEVEARARRQARENVDREWASQSAGGVGQSRSARYSKPNYVAREREERDYISPTVEEPEQEYLPPDPF